MAGLQSYVSIELRGVEWRRTVCDTSAVVYDFDAGRRGVEAALAKYFV